MTLEESIAFRTSPLITRRVSAGGLPERGADLCSVEVVAHAVPGDQRSVDVVAEVRVVDDLVHGFPGPEEQVLPVRAHDGIEDTNVLGGLRDSVEDRDEDRVF